MAQKESTSTTKATQPWGGAFGALGAVWEQMGKNPKPAVLYIGTYLVATIISLLLQEQTSYLDPNHNSYEDIVALIFLLALPVYALALADRKSITISQFMQFNGKKYVALLVAFVLSLAIVLGGFLLLVVPVIWAMGWVFVASYAVVDKAMGPIAAIKESKRLTKGHLGKVWGLIGATMLLYVPAFIFMLIVPYSFSIVAVQLVSVIATGAAALLYRWLQTTSPNAS